MTSPRTRFRISTEVQSPRLTLLSEPLFFPFTQTSRPECFTVQCPIKTKDPTGLWGPVSELPLVSPSRGHPEPKL